MSKFLGIVGIGVLLILWLGPWGLLLVEGTWLFFTGHVLSSVPWDADRVLIAICWPLLIGCFIAVWRD
jgi:hypothetical protein